MTKVRITVRDASKTKEVKQDADKKKGSSGKGGGK